MNLFKITVALLCACSIQGAEIVRKALTTPGSAVEWGNPHFTSAAAIATLQGNCIQIGGNSVGYAGALRADGSLIFWGPTTYGKTNAPTTGVFTCIAVGWHHSVAVRNDGKVIEWGLPDERPEWSEQYQHVFDTVNNAVSVAAGDNHSAVLRADKTVKVWGQRSSVVSSANAVTNGIIDIASGWYNVTVLKEDGTVAAWGTQPATGTGGGNNLNPPASATNVVRIACGMFHTLALRGDGTVVAWGQNSYGQATVPDGLTNVVAIGAGRYHSSAILNDGTMVMWGIYRNELGVPNYDTDADSATSNSHWNGQTVQPTSVTEKYVAFAGVYGSAMAQAIVYDEAPNPDPDPGPDPDPEPEPPTQGIFRSKFNGTIILQGEFTIE